MERSHLEEEARALLRQIVERQAYRQLMAANIRGHGLQFLPGLDAKVHFTRELDLHLNVLREVERIYQELGGGDLHQAVRERMSRIPYPQSRLELAICLALTLRAERVAARVYMGCAHKGFGSVAATLAEMGHAMSRLEEDLFVAYCAEERHGPQAQQFWDRWLTISLFSLGRPGSRGDTRAVALKLRTAYVSDVVGAFLKEADPLRKSCRLAWPDVVELGVELPPGLSTQLSERVATRALG
ncbi:MAG: hypothetical protein ACI841_003312 [Planctomycetota bacterium]|jgi:hypothetical protein